MENVLVKKEWIYTLSKELLIHELLTYGLSTKGSLDELRQTMSGFVSQHPELFQTPEEETNFAIGQNQRVIRASSSAPIEASSIVDTNEVRVKYEPRPFITVYLQGWPLRALIDSGAEISIINRYTAKLACQLRYRPRIQKSEIQLVDGSAVTIAGTILLPLQIGRRIYQHSFLVMLNVAEDVIIGTDLWIRLQIPLCPPANTSRLCIQAEEWIHTRVVQSPPEADPEPTPTGSEVSTPPNTPDHGPPGKPCSDGAARPSLEGSQQVPISTSDSPTLQRTRRALLRELFGSNSSESSWASSPDGQPETQSTTTSARNSSPPGSPTFSQRSSCVPAKRFKDYNSPTRERSPFHQPTTQVPITLPTGQTIQIPRKVTLKRRTYRAMVEGKRWVLRFEDGVLQSARQTNPSLRREVI